MSIHPTAIIDPTAQVHPNNDIGPNVRIGPGSVIGEGNIFMQGAVLGPNTRVGKGNTFHYYCVVGHDPQYLGFDPATKSGTIIGDGNHFREFSQVHRGLKDGTNTILGNANFIMTTAHIAHDCILGNNNVLVNYSGISGHVELGDRCFLSGQVAVHQFCRIGTLAMIGGRTGISKDVPPYMIMKHYGVVVGINSVGLRRAGVSSETRLALKRAYKQIFRSGSPVSKSIEIIRAEWEGKTIPAEVAHLLEFCSTKSKRGLSRGPRAGATGAELEGGDAE